MRIEREIHLPAPPETVYDLIVDPRRLGDWVTIHRGLRRVPAGPLEAGSELVQTLAIASVPIEIAWTVITARRPREVVWDGHGPARSRARIEYRLAPVGSGTRFAYINEFELPGGPFGRIAAAAMSTTRLADREMDQSLARLRRLLER